MSEKHRKRTQNAQPRPLDDRAQNRKPLVSEEPSGQNAPLVATQDPDVSTTMSPRDSSGTIKTTTPAKAESNEPAIDERGDEHANKVAADAKNTVLPENPPEVVHALYEDPHTGGPEVLDEPETWKHPPAATQYNNASISGHSTDRPPTTQAASATSRDPENRLQLGSFEFNANESAAHVHRVTLPADSLEDEDDNWEDVELNERPKRRPNGKVKPGQVYKMPEDPNCGNPVLKAKRAGGWCSVQ